MNLNSTSLPASEKSSSQEFEEINKKHIVERTPHLSDVLHADSIL